MGHWCDVDEADGNSCKKAPCIYVVMCVCQFVNRAHVLRIGGTLHLRCQPEGTELHTEGYNFLELWWLKVGWQQEPLRVYAQKWDVD